MQMALAASGGLPAASNQAHAPQTSTPYPYNFPQIYVTDIPPSMLMEAAARQQPLSSVGTIQQLPPDVVARALEPVFNPPPRPSLPPLLLGAPAAGLPANSNQALSPGLVGSIQPQEEQRPVIARPCPVHRQRTTRRLLPVPLPQRCFIPGKKIMLVVEGLDTAVFNVSRIFNLFCVYGNVMSVKLLDSPTSGRAVVEMDCEEVCSRCVRYLDGLQAFSGTLKVGWTTREEAPDSSETFTVNGNMSYHDSSTCKVNRFTTAARAIRNVCGRPSKILFAYNIPNIALPEIIKEVFEVHCPTGRVTVVDLRALMRRAEILDRSTRKYYCVLITFEDVKKATEGLIGLNNATVSMNDGSGRFQLRLRYASETPAEMLALRTDPPLSYLYAHDHGDDGSF